MYVVPSNQTFEPPPPPFKAYEAVTEYDDDREYDDDSA